LAAQDSAVEELEGLLKSLSKAIGERLEQALKGKATGDTPLEEALKGLKEDDQVKAVVFSTKLDEIGELVDDAGLGFAREAWFQRYRELADLAEQALGTQGIEEADRILEQEDARIAIEALVQRHDDALWEGMERASSVRIIDSLHSQVGLLSHHELAQMIYEAEEASIPQALTEARTRIAEADRFFSEEAAQAADPQGKILLRAYTGPDDRRTRPFCDALVGKAFKPEELRPLNNNQTGTHPIDSGGGYNCRHGWVSIFPKLISELGYQRGTKADIQAANAGARKARKKKKKKVGSK